MLHSGNIGICPGSAVVICLSGVVGDFFKRRRSMTHENIL